MSVFVCIHGPKMGRKSVVVAAAVVVVVLQDSVRGGNSARRFSGLEMGPWLRFYAES